MVLTRKAAAPVVTETPALPALQLVDTPETLQEVLVSCLIFYTVRLLVNRLAEALPAPPRALLRAAPSTPAAAAAAAAQPPALGPLAAGVAAVAAVGAEAGAAAAGGQGIKPTRSEEQESEGVKYEGYAEAIAAAQVGQHSSHFFSVCLVASKGIMAHIGTPSASLATLVLLFPPSQLVQSHGVRP